MDGHVQTLYPRKNWSSLMLFSCDHPSVRKLTPGVVNTRDRFFLRRLQWCPIKIWAHFATNGTGSTGEQNALGQEQRKWCSSPWRPMVRTMGAVDYADVVACRTSSIAGRCPLKGNLSLLTNVAGLALLEYNA